MKSSMLRSMNRQGATNRVGSARRSGLLPFNDAAFLKRGSRV